MDLEATTGWVRGLLARQDSLISEGWVASSSSRLKDERDLVTEIDEQVERRLRSELEARFPDHGLRGEELEDVRPEAAYQWLIDPIDGTKYFAAQSSLFSISVALLRDGKPVLGVVRNVTAGQDFHAWEGGGAFLDANRLSGPKASRLATVIANVDTPGSSKLGDKERAWFEEKLVLLTRNVYRVRSLGSGALSACWLATGAFDAYLDLTGLGKPEDLAAGWVLMQEAGARVEKVHVEIGPPRLLAAPPAIWSELRDLLL